MNQRTIHNPHVLTDVFVIREKILLFSSCNCDILTLLLNASAVMLSDIFFLFLKLILYDVLCTITWRKSQIVN